MRNDDVPVTFLVIIDVKTLTVFGEHADVICDDYLLSLLSASGIVPSNTILPQYQRQHRPGQQQQPLPHLVLLEAQDRNGWTPLHYSCAHAAAAAPVVQTLAEYRLPTKLVQTEMGMTPLHLALIGTIREYSDLIVTLTSTGACFAKDGAGMLVSRFYLTFGIGFYLILTNLSNSKVFQFGVSKDQHTHGRHWHHA